MARSVTLRKNLEWNLIFLSSGEIGLTDLITQAGEKVRGGQEVRMIDLETDATIAVGEHWDKLLTQNHKVDI